MRRFYQKSAASQRGMIVKVQLPLAASGTEPLALIYDQDKTVLVQVPVTGPLLAAMKGAKKRFFRAEVVHDSIELGEETPDPGW